MLRNTSKFIFLSIFLSFSSCHFIANYQIIGVWKATEIFENELAKERRIEFAFENMRWFDLLRYKTTMPSQDPLNTMKANFNAMWTGHYSKYPSPAPLLPTIQSYVTTEKLLLPIPQREIDNNTKIVIPQNPGY